MLPLLDAVKDGREHLFRDLVEFLASKFNLSSDERKHLLPSGRYPTFDNRVGWAKTYLKKAGLLAQSRRSYISITDRGVDVLASKPASINMKYLEKFPEYLAFKEQSSEETQKASTSIVTTSETPEELLLAMGYGGSRVEAGRAIGQSGDGGIDGIIDEDKLGLDSIYIQAKRWEGTVGRPEIQKFVGALQGNRAHKGVFITTSDFSKDAQEYVKNISNKVVLINGFTLAKLMIENDVGVSTVSIYKVKKIDSDYFVDE